MRRGYDVYESKIGPIGMVVSEAGVEQIFLLKEHMDDYLNVHPEVKKDIALCKEVKKQLEEYFLGKRLKFDLPLVWEGTAFRKKVWKALIEIPYGETRSYGELAAYIGNPKACRAVGGANRANDLPIIIPCHRVIGSTGKLVGFMGTRTDVQERLLAHEKEILAKKRD
ncbi:MAG: methylated-DNA--[protein]-cysteine S-methyltransferase [Candidatus Cellulosilyticum pullistercoris]|uniref:Methylated-DNA--protein-cysteine methyltransferase n=1 Tax=Candidatus Cellulosilyticum pullistercoris TaxID=2838521 RepID=A0A9E2KAY3_9FIRM|nr:methylated-DNA--[protein]-cysteine S-methyltransferase [Candidatus Cellulosilyticum pullistercoris]